MSSGAWRALCLLRSGGGAAEVVAAARGDDASPGAPRCADWQGAVLAAVADAPDASARRVLRAALLAAESGGEEVRDALADAYAAQLLRPEPPAGLEDGGATWSHRLLSYAFADDASQNDAQAALGTVALRCSADLLAGSTGCASWEAGLALAEAAFSRPDAFAGRRVLELGAGAGAATVAIARAAPAQLRATDGSGAALANLRHNLEANGVALREPGGDGEEGVTCALLAWEALTPQVAAALAPDVVVGADLIYDPSNVPALLRCVALLLSRGAHDGAAPTGLPATSAGGEAPHALLVSLLRSPESYSYFEATAAAMGLRPDDVTHEVLGADDDQVGAVRFCHLPRGAMPRERLRAHRLHPPR